MFRRRTQIADALPAEAPEGDLGSVTPSRPPAARWADSRGNPRAELAADVIGSFPGFADYAGLIVDATVVLTDRFLLVDEGEPHGFGIGVAQLDRVGVEDAELRVGYRQDGERRSFVLRVRRSLRAPRPRAAAAGLLGALRFARVAGDFPPADQRPAATLSWDDAAAVEHERVRWTGRVTAPIAAGAECTPSDVWVSLESLLWSSPRSSGVNRVPLGEILSLAEAEIAGVPSIPSLYVTVDDGDGGLLDLPFIFNLGEPVGAARNRADLRSHLRGDRLPESTLPARIQPWLGAEDEAAELPMEPESEDEAVSAGDGLPAPGTAGPDAEPPATPDAPADEAAAMDDAPSPSDAPVFANWPSHDSHRGPLSAARRPLGEGRGGIAARRWRHTRGVDGAPVPDPAPEEPEPTPPMPPPGEDIVLAELAGAEPERAYAAWPGVDVAIDEQPVGPPPPPEPTLVPAYERAARATIDAVLFVIARRVEGNSAPPLTSVPPSSADQAAALAELLELTAAGVMTPEEARDAKARLVAVGEASVRLRTLLELSGAGHLSLAELVVKRDAILKAIDYPVNGGTDGT